MGGGGGSFSFFQIKYGTLPYNSKICLIPLKRSKKYLHPPFEFAANGYIRKAYMITFILQINLLQALALQWNHQMITDTLNYLTR